MKSMLPIVFALLTGLFWGTYGPVLSQARFFEKSAFKPYVMIGVAYLVWGVLGGLIGMASTKKEGEALMSFTQAGMFWGFAAGTLGAWGALTLTLAMFTGGTAMPQVVMPIVFGTAVSVSAITAAFTTKADTNPLMWVGIAGMAVCIVVVAYFTPHPHPPAKPGAPANPHPAADAKA